MTVAAKNNEVALEIAYRHGDVRDAWELSHESPVSKTTAGAVPAGAASYGITQPPGSTSGGTRELPRNFEPRQEPGA